MFFQILSLLLQPFLLVILVVVTSMTTVLFHNTQFHQPCFKELIMRNVASVLLVSSLLFVSPVMAATGHDHGAGGHSHGSISSNEVIVKATQKVKSLVESAKLDKSWADIKADGAKTQDNEWVVLGSSPKSSIRGYDTFWRSIPRVASCLPITHV